MPTTKTGTVPGGDWIVIEPTKGWVDLELGKIWEQRELLYILAWRSVKSRYQQTSLGVAWALLQPLMTVLVFTLVFGRLAKVPSDGLPYAVFSMAALVPWNFFSNSVTNCAHSLLTNSALVKKVYFPRLIVPVSTLLAGVVDFGVSLLLLLVVALVFGVVPGIKILLLPVFILVAAAAALGFGLWLGALNVKYRDVAFVIGFLMQLWTYATPVVWSISMVPERWRVWIGLNPMAGVVQGFRWALFEGQESPWSILAVSLAVSLVVLVSGAYYFRRVDREFADLA